MCSLFLRWYVLRAVGPEGLLGGAGSVGVRLVLGGASFARRSGPISGHDWGLAAWCVFCARLRVFLFVMRWIIPLCLILTAFFPPSRSACRNLCVETSYLRVQCLWGRADGWGARAVGATILDVFGYGLPTESGLGSQWRCCYCRGQEVGNHSEKDIGPPLGKFAFIPSSHLKIQCRRGARQNFPLKI